MKTLEEIFKIAEQMKLDVIMSDKYFRDIEDVVLEDYTFSANDDCVVVRVIAEENEYTKKGDVYEINDFCNFDSKLYKFYELITEGGF